MGRDSFSSMPKSTSSSNRFSFNNTTSSLNPTNVTLNNAGYTNTTPPNNHVHANISNNSNSSNNSSGSSSNRSTNHSDHLHLLPLHNSPHKHEQQSPPQQQQQLLRRSPDLEVCATGVKFNKKPRTPSPDLRSTLHVRLFKRRSGRNCLFILVLSIGLLLPIWIFATGAITLESFNDVIRYLPGYHHFANNLLYLVMFLLLVSFTVLATLPILPILMLGLPFHLLILSIFRKLMSDWVWWCVGCYTVLFMAPFGSAIIAKGKGIFMDSLKEAPTLIRHKSSSGLTLGISTKYTPLSNGVSIGDGAGMGPGIGGAFNSNQGSVLEPVTNVLREGLGRMGQRLEQFVYLFSITNRTSIRWRLLLALVFFWSYVLPVTRQNESRIFNPARSAPSFDINHPEPLCAARELNVAGYEDGPRHTSFEGYWQEYLEFHREMVKPESEGGVPFHKKKYLVFQPSDDGLGNRLQALLSSVVLAMVSRRAIILDWVAMPQCNANFADLFEHPPGLAWDMNTTLPEGFRETAEYKKKPEIWYPYCRNCALRSPVDSSSTWSKLLCKEDLGLNSTVPLVQIFSTQWFLPVIQHNPFWRSELCHMFPDGGKNAFEVLAKTLLKPAKPVQEKIDQVMNRIPKDTILIGLQVRRTENNAVEYDIEDAFLTCAATVVEEESARISRTDFRRTTSADYNNSAETSNGLYADVAGIVQSGHAMGAAAGMKRQESDFLISNSATTSVGPTMTETKFAYYLATDYRPTRTHFQNILGDQLFVLDNTFSPITESTSSKTSARHSLDSEYSSSLSTDTGGIGKSGSIDAPTSVSEPQREAVARNSVPGVQMAVAEMFLLAQADRIISSPYSTFGYFAHGYANVQPNIVKRDGTCIHRKSTQPCFQYWFGFANGGASCPIKATIEMSEDYDCWL